MIKIAILVVCFVLTIVIMKIFPKIGDFSAYIIKLGLDPDTSAALNKIPIDEKPSRVIKNIFAFALIYFLLYFGANYFFKDMLN